MEKIWTTDELNRLDALFTESTPDVALRWGLETFGQDLALATGFGPSGVVLMHLVSLLEPAMTVFYLDTDLLFDETYALRDRIEARLGLTFTRVAGPSLDEQAVAAGPALWRREPDRCCFLRKVQPLRHFLATRRAWISGLRRDQSATRADVQIVGWDAANGLVKINPLAAWTSNDVWRYIQAHNLPYNDLHDAGYPSLGCRPCTRPVSVGENERAGRWAGRVKTECGIHLQPQAA